MIYKLLQFDIWDRITALAQKHPSKCCVAVAYFGRGASKLLPLRCGSTLVVDMSKASVSAGQTDPSEILKLLKTGVEVHSVENLHAKVFVLGNRAVVGSMNASRRSATVLFEAALETTDEAVVSACRAFVLGLTGEYITPQYARKLRECYRPPHIPGGKATHGKSRTPSHSPLRVVPLVRREWDADDKAASAQGLPSARSKIRSTRQYRIDQFCWTGSTFLDRLEEGDLIMQVIQERRKMVYPAARVVHVEPYTTGRGSRGIVFLEQKKRLRPKGLSSVLQRLGPRAKVLRKVKGPRTLRNAQLIHALLNLWPSGLKPQVELV